MDWDEIEEKARMLNARVKRVFQEEMQKAILTSLSRKGCFDYIVFHGGTALRLFHGNPRFSEDIDLVLLEGNDYFDLSKYMINVERTCLGTFPFLQNVKVKVQKNEQELQRYILKAISEDTKQNIRIHIEIADVPSYRNSPKILNFPPFQPAVRVEDEEEILADKVRALGYRPFLKGRDLWDIYFLNSERSVELDVDLVVRKISDYNENVNEIDIRYEKIKKKIQTDGLSILSNEMDRFLPKHVLDSYRPIYKEILKSVIQLISGFEGSMEGRDHEGQ
jgi:predicted nucleotidyltransferase component of viral defense system